MLASLTLILAPFLILLEENMILFREMVRLLTANSVPVIFVHFLLLSGPTSATVVMLSRAKNVLWSEVYSPV